MSSIQLGFYQIMAGEAKCIMAGGADCMSAAPFMVFDARYGKKYGHLSLIHIFLLFEKGYKRFLVIPRSADT